MRVFRLSRKRFSDNLSGKGAAKYGNRWNSKGTEMIYCAANRALAMAEVAVHVNPAILPSDFMMLEIDIPKTITIQQMEENKLPYNWAIFPHLLSSQKIGGNFIAENKFAVLKVPSAVVKGDYNLLLNPFHPDFKKIEIVDSYEFLFDRRLFRR